jgi:hypothetical protein
MELSIKLIMYFFHVLSIRHSFRGVRPRYIVHHPWHQALVAGIRKAKWAESFCHPRRYIEGPSRRRKQDGDAGRQVSSSAHLAFFFLLLSLSLSHVTQQNPSCIDSLSRGSPDCPLSSPLPWTWWILAVACSSSIMEALEI